MGGRGFPLYYTFITWQFIYAEETSKKLSRIPERRKKRKLDQVLSSTLCDRLRWLWLQLLIKHSRSHTHIWYTHSYPTLHAPIGAQKLFHQLYISVHMTVWNVYKIYSRIKNIIFYLWTRQFTRRHLYIL